MSGMQPGLMCKQKERRRKTLFSALHLFPAEVKLLEFDNFSRSVAAPAPSPSAPFLLSRGKIQIQQFGVCVGSACSFGIRINAKTATERFVFPVGP